MGVWVWVVVGGEETAQEQLRTAVLRSRLMAFFSSLQATNASWLAGPFRRRPSALRLQPHQPRAQPVRIVPSQSAQPTPLPRPVPSVQHAARPPLAPHTPHASSLPSCPGRGKMAKFLSPDEMTSRDYYFDSYAHFGIHEVLLRLQMF